ncbi:MAG: DUF2189 domain-containing protein [Pseudomonadota bacterium]
MGQTTEYLSERRSAESPTIRPLKGQDFWHALYLGFMDLRRAPGISLPMAALYVVGCICLTLLRPFGPLTLISAALAFALLLPYSAVGFFETSRRLERGLRLDWPEVWTVIRRQRSGEVPWIAAIVALSGLAYILAMAFLAVNGWVITISIIFTIAVGLVICAVTVLALPLVMDRQFDLAKALMLSLTMVRQNPGITLAWTTIAALMVFVSSWTGYLGLLLAVPLLGHGSWHLYRRAFRQLPTE